MVGFSGQICDDEGGMTEMEILSRLLNESKVKRYLGFCLAIVMSVCWWHVGTENIKHLVLGGGLCLGCGILIASRRFPDWMSWLILAVYLLYVPWKLFTRMELPVHDMGALNRSAGTVSLMIIYCIYMMCFVIFQRISSSLGAGNILLLLVTIIEYYVYSFRGSVLGLDDFKAAKTALTVWGGYNYTPSHELVYSFLWFLFFIILAFKIRIKPETVKKYLKKYNAFLVHLVVSILFSVICLVFFHILVHTPFLEKHGIDNMLWAQYASNEVNGNLLTPIIQYRDSRMDIPEGYSEKKLAGIGERVQEQFVRTKDTNGLRPNIICIMNEAFSDPRVLGDFKTNEPFMEYLDTLYGDGNSVRGKLYMSILGGLTVNSEFEFLTGNTMSFLAQGVVPYFSMIDKPMPSLVSELKYLGYATMAIHPNVKIAYGREQVYESLGFDQFIDINSFHVPLTYRGTYISDECNYEELIRQYEHREEGRPFFIFNVTIQNHSPYWDENREIRILSVNGEEEGEFNSYGVEESYLSMIRASDQAFEKLTGYFKNVDEPTIICMFGDHQAFLGNEFYDRLFEGKEFSDKEKRNLKYIVPYVMWANYDADFSSKGDFSANYLGAVLMEQAGLPLSQFRMFQLELLEKYPVLSAIQCCDPAGREIDGQELSADELINEYRMFQYDKMFSDSITESVYIPEDLPVKEETGSAVDSEGEWFERFQSVTHAMGITGEGDAGTNSLEAFLYNYKRGQRVFEGDIQITSDQKMVFRHDWDMDQIQKKAYGLMEGEEGIPTEEEFLHVPVRQGKYTPMSLEQFFGLMHKYPDIYLITDTKFSTTVQDDFRLFVDTALSNGNEDVLDRVIVRFYYEDMYREIESVYHFKNYIFTLYYIGFPEDVGGLTDFMESNHISVLTMPFGYWSEAKEKISENRSFKVYLHTVNDIDIAESLLMDADGLYTDTLTEKMIDYLIQEMQ